jgi:hypothetical protein
VTSCRAGRLPRAYKVGMITGTQEPFSREFQAATQQDPLELAAQLSDALAMLEQCRARNMDPGEEFLDFVDFLLCEVDMMEIFGRVHAA